MGRSVGRRSWGRPAVAAFGVTTLSYFQAATSLNSPQLAICFVRYAGSFSVSDTARSICRHYSQSKRFIDYCAMLRVLKFLPVACFVFAPRSAGGERGHTLRRTELPR
jgi:hypothetical protein